MIRDEDFLKRRIESARDAVRHEWIPAEEEVEETGRLPLRILQQMRKRRMFGFLIPADYGGDGMTCEELALINIEISQCSVAFRTRVANNNGVAANVLLHGATTAQKATYLSRMASGEIVAAVAVTEPEYGSEATGLTTSAVKDGDRWVLNGEKAFITNGPIADIYIVFARTGSPDSGSKGISAFVIERGDPGFQSSEAYRGMGQRGAPFSTLLFSDCRIPADRLLGDVVGTAFRSAWFAFVFQRIQLAALSIGPAIRLVEEGLRWAKSRTQFGKYLIDQQMTQAKLADSQTEIEAARALVLETARKYDKGLNVTMEASICKYFATEMVCRVADRVVQLFGARGYFSDFSCVERLYRDVRAGRFAEGTSEIHQLTIAREMVKRISSR